MSTVERSVFADGILEGRVAFVTGGGTGITGGVARALSEAGARVALVSRKLENLEPAAAKIRAAGGEALSVSADVRDFAQVERAVATALSRFGRIDIVVNGAAGNFLCPAAELSPNGFGTVVDIDLKGTFNVCRATFEELKKRRGQILNISATLHYLGTPLQLHVSAAKAGVDALTRNLAVEWRQRHRPRPHRGHRRHEAARAAGSQGATATQRPARSLRTYTRHRAVRTLPLLRRRELHQRGRHRR